MNKKCFQSIIYLWKYIDSDQIFDAMANRTKIH